MKKITLLILFLSTLWGYSQVKTYGFTQSNGTYTEITGGTVLGSESSDQEFFVDAASPSGSTSVKTGIGISIGFNFIFNGVSYDRFAVNNNGWIALGSSAYTPSVNMAINSNYNPINSTVAFTPDVLSARIAVLGTDLQAQTGAVLSFSTTGTAPNRVLTIQWKNYRRSFVTGDLLNFQMKLYETANSIDFVYGSFSATNSLTMDCGIGLRAEPSATASNFINRTSVLTWSTSPGTASTDIVKLSPTLKPTNGLTFTWTPPACPDPKVLVSSTIGTNSATLTWGTSLPAPSGGYEYVLSTSATAPTGSGAPINVPTVTRTDLAPNTQYTLFVRSLCGTTFTQWILAGTFKTECLDVNAFTENFDSYPTGSGSLPDCWKTIAFSGASAYIDTGSVFPDSAPNKLYLLPNGSIASSVYVILPNTGNLQTGTNRLKFKAYAGTANKTFDVGYFTNPSDVNTFNIVKTITVPSTTAATALEFAVSVPALPQGIKNLVFRNVGTSTLSGSAAAVSIDDVIWQGTPACADVKSIAVKLPTSNSVQLTWDTTGTETAWQYIYGPSTVTDPYSLPTTSITNAGSKAVTVGNLMPNTSYKVWVRSNCGSGVYGYWSGSTAFLTPCQSVDSVTEDFDLNPTLPNCWSKMGTSGTVSIVSSVGTASTNALALTSTTTTDAVFAAIPSLSSYASSGYRMKFKYISSSGSGSLQVICYKDPLNFDPNDPTTYTVLKTLIPSVKDNVYTFSEALGATATPYLGFRFFNTSISSLYIDDFSWTPTSTCSDVSAVGVNGVTGESVDLGWTAGGMEDNWQYAITDSKASDPNALTVNNFDYPFSNSGYVIGTIPNLAPSTPYKVWIRSRCNSTSLGAWIGPLYVTTNCAAVDGFVQNFDASTNFPNCWSKVGSKGSASVAALPGTSSPNVLRLDGNVNFMPIVAMQPVTNSGDATNLLRFKLSGTDMGGTVEVGYIINIQDPSTFIPLKTFTVSTITGFSSEFADLGFEPASQVLAFRNPGIVNNNATSVFIDDVVWEPVPACSDITANSVTGSTSATVDLNWKKGAAETAWQYALGNSTVSDPKTLTAGTFVSPAVHNQNVAATVGGLTPSTSYKVWIRSKCTNTSFGSWIGPLSFATTCAPVDKFTEKFDLNTNIPDCWSKIGTDGTVAVSALAGTPSGSNAMSLVSTSSAKAIVAMRPVSNSGAGTYRLRFKFSSTVPSGNIQVGYLTNIADPYSFNLVASVSVTAANVFYSKIIKPGTAPTSAVLAFRNPDVSTVYLDDVIWEPIPTCLDVTAVTPLLASNKTLNVSWTAGGSETAWQYALGLSTDSDPDALTVVDFVAPTLTAPNVVGMLSGLTSSTSYKIWVRSKCDTSFGVWSDPTSFATTCDPIDTFTQSFDASTAMPTCWSKVGAGGTATVNAVSNTPSDGNRLYMYASPGVKPVVAMPVLSNAQAGPYRLKFKFRSNIAGSTLEVGYLKLISDPNSFVSLTSYQASAATASNNTTYDNIVCELGTAPGSQVLAFRNVSSDTNTTILYIDDVVWEPKPLCPEIKNLAVTSVASNALGITWIKGTSETMWQYALGGSVVSNPAALTAVDVPSSQTSPTSVTINNLSPSTIYNVWVRAKCSDTSFGTWIGPVTIATSCNPSSNFTQNFDASVNVPDCWRKVGASGDVVVSALVGASSPNVLDLNNATGNAIVVMPPVSNAAAGTYRLKFKFRSSVANGTLELGYVADAADQASFVPLETYTSSSTTAFDSKIALLGTKPASGILAFRNPATLQSHIYIDDVVWEPTPSCTDVVNVAVKLPTSNSVQLSWDATGTETAWQYAYASSAVTDPSTLPTASIFDATSKAVTVGGLSPNTSYKIWVRSKCADGVYGLWTESATFLTSCPSVQTIAENFEAGLALPDCWHKMGTNGTVSVVSSTVLYSPNALELKTVMGITNAVYVAIPPLSTATSGVYRMRFKYKSLEASSVLEVVSFKDPINLNDASSYTVLKSVIASVPNNAYDFNEVLPVADTPYLGLIVYNMNGTGTVYIDDFAWEPLALPNCATGIAAAADLKCGNRATSISWPATDNATGYKLTIGTASGASDVVSNQDLGNVLSYKVTGNSKTTYYYTLKPYNVLGDAVGCAEKTFTTNANTCYCPSIPTSNEASGITNVKIGATNFTNPDVTYNDFTSKPVNVAQGAFSNMRVTFNVLPFYYGINIWIDFNDDYVFDQSEMVFFGNSIYGDPNVLNTSFTMPANVPLGMHGMRIVATQSSQSLGDPCYNGAHGVTLDFKVNIVAPAANDEAVGAMALTPGNVFASNAITGSNVNATGSWQVADPGCGNYNGMDVWYKAVVPASGNLTFEVNSVSGGITNTAAAVYSGNAGSPMQINCDDSSSVTGKGINGDQPKLRVTGRTPGEVLFLRVWENGGDAFGSFAVSAYDNASLGIDDFETNNFAYYPNPVRDILNLSLDQEIANVAVYNLLGQQVIDQSANGNEAKVDLSGLSKGAYLVKVTAGNQSKTVKVIKE